MPPVCKKNTLARCLFEDLRRDSDHFGSWEVQVAFSHTPSREAELPRTTKVQWPRKTLEFPCPPMPFRVFAKRSASQFQIDRDGLGNDHLLQQHALWKWRLSTLVTFVFANVHGKDKGKWRCSIRAPSSESCLFWKRFLPKSMQGKSSSYTVYCTGSLLLGHWSADAQSRSFRTLLSPHICKSSQTKSSYRCTNLESAWICCVFEWLLFVGIQAFLDPRQGTRVQREDWNLKASMCGSSTAKHGLALTTTDVVSGREFAPMALYPESWNIKPRVIAAIP